MKFVLPMCYAFSKKVFQNLCLTMIFFLGLYSVINFVKKNTIWCATRKNAKFTENIYNIYYIWTLLNDTKECATKNRKESRKLILVIILVKISKQNYKGKKHWIMKNFAFFIPSIYIIFLMLEINYYVQILKGHYILNKKHCFLKYYWKYIY